MDDLETKMRSKVGYLIAILAINLHFSQETCDVYRKTTPVYSFERLLYNYVGCSSITSSSDLRSEILSKLNKTIEYVEISNSNIRELKKNTFTNMNLIQLTFINADLQAIEENAFERANISTINLNNNKISKLGNACFNTSYLYVLNLQNNSITEITSGIFTGLDLLKNLNLQSNQILDIHPDAFDGLVSLEVLNLSFNKLSVIPINLFKPLKKAEDIFLNNNFIKQLDVAMFTSNSALQCLSFQNNYLTSLDGTLYPASIVYINAEYNMISKLNVSNLKNLMRLILNNNNLTDIKSSLVNLPSLTYLHLNNNNLGQHINEVPFKDMKNLTIIEIDKNNVETFDFKRLQTLSQLSGVSLAENKLKRIDLRGCDIKLKLLNLSSNLIDEVVNISSIKGLSRLELSHNKLQVISYDMFAGMNSLQNLWLQYNSIKKLTMGCFRDLKAVSELNLSHNRISNITSGIFNGLNIINTLDLSYNNLSYFNEDVFHNMKILKSLNIAFNNLSNINVRKILSHTTWLREINLNGNNWTCKSLVNIVRDYKIVTLTSGTAYDVSNVYGIPCNDTDDDVHLTKAQYLPDIIRLVNLTEQNTRNMSYRAGVTNFIIILLVILFLCKYIFEKYYSYIAVTKQFLYHKTTNEQEMQLV